MAANDAFLVEGRDDLYTIEAIWRHHNDTDFPCRIQDSKGIERLLENVRLRLKAQDSDNALQRLGIVVDADSDIETTSGAQAELAARWQSLCAILLRSGYEGVPAEPQPEGTILRQPGRPTIGIWLMPNNTLSGMLEDFLRALVPADDALLIRATSCLDAIPPEHCRFASRHRSKALIHTWLAWQQKPGEPFGQAFRANVFDASATEARRLVAWMNRLFERTQA